jgi:FAD/FMN-containing dehydrogenase
MGQQMETRAYIDTADAAVRSLRRSFAGTVLLPGDERYDVARRPLHPIFEPRPVMVAEAADAADVRAAIVTAREHDLPFAVQSTGHGTIVPSDGGVLLKTSRMATVLVDPDRRLAKVGPGARWSEVIAAAAPFGLVPISGSAPSVGVAGYTLGGGVGWLSRAYGFGADSLLRADVVTADGRMVTASRDSNPDLFWALRGGGGNFGVVTSLEVRLYPVASVYAGTAYFSIDRAADVLDRYRAWSPAVPDEMSTALVLTRMPDSPKVPEPVRDRPVLALQVMHNGSGDAAERLLRPMRAITGPALLDDFRSMRYADAAMGGTPPRQFDLFNDLPDPVIRALVRAVTENDSAVSQVEVRHWGGAMARPGPDAGPVGHRDVPYSITVNAREEELAAALRPYATGGSFLNFLSDPKRTATAYTAPNHRRLAELKRIYDPGNFFHRGHNVPPSSRRRVA